MGSVGGVLLECEEPVPGSGLSVASEECIEEEEPLLKEEADESIRSKRERRDRERRESEKSRKDMHTDTHGRK